MDQLLILFDIDGTLIHHVGKQIQPKDRFQTAIEEVYSVTLNLDAPSIDKFMGITDRDFAWKLLEGSGVSREEFLEKFPLWVDVNHKYLSTEAQQQTVYIPIAEAKLLVEKLWHQQVHVLGLLTGNAARVADWKLDHTGLNEYFSFGLFGDEADNRIELAKRVFIKARDTIGKDFVGKQIVVIGDTIRDIDCGEAIEAFTIGVTTGGHNNRQDLVDRGADMVVDNLVEEPVLKLFGLE